MNKKIIVLIVAIIVIAVVGVFLIMSPNNKDESDNNSSINTIENQNSNEIQEENTNNNIGEETQMPKLNIKVGNKNFSATLYDNETTREFINNMPLTINMSELNGNEKYYYMDKSLKTNSENVRNIKKGDLMLYGSDCLVLFYKSFSTSYSYTKLGYIDDVSDLEQAVGKENINVTFELQN